MKKIVIFLFFVLIVLSCAPKREVLKKPEEIEAPPISPKKVGLALGGGGARGFSEIGVLRVLEQEKIPISYVAGTSVGSLIGALYCDQGRVVDLEYYAMSLENEDIFDYNYFAILSGGIIKGDKLENFLSQNLRHKILEDFKIPLIVVATDLRTGQKVGFETGSVPIAVHASCAIPGIFQPVKIGNTLFVDGGVAEQVPVSFLKDKGLDVIIAVAIPPEIPSEPPQKTSDIIRHSLSIMFSKISDCSLSEADVIIKPKCGDVKFNDFSRRKELILAGEEAAREVLPKIKEMLEE